MSEDEEDYGALIYRESQLRKAEATAAAVAAVAVKDAKKKKKNKKDVTTWILYHLLHHC